MDEREKKQTDLFKQAKKGISSLCVVLARVLQPLLWLSDRQRFPNGIHGSPFAVSRNTANVVDCKCRFPDGPALGRKLHAKLQLASTHPSTLIKLKAIFC